MMQIYTLKSTILERCRKMKNGVMLVVAPTGSGKTTAFRNIAGENENVFGTTVMIQPNRMASKTMAVNRVRMTTPIQLLENYFRHRSLGCQTLIVDEVHTRTEEYETILRILADREAKRTRIILLTATADMPYLRGYFPHMSRLELPIETPFPIEIRYETVEKYQFPNHRMMIPDVERILTENPEHKRILVFVYTREQCDKMAREMKGIAQKDGMATFGLYGGMTDEEMDDWKYFRQMNDRFILFATNVAETSITIPGISLVIDFGVRCIQRGTRVIHDVCTKSNLIQRAGRTGRTCPGTVVRMMTREQYDQRPFQDSPEYSWDMLAVRMLRHRMNPTHFLPEEADVPSIIQRFRRHGLLSSRSHLDHEMSTFIVQSPLLFKNSCRLYRLLSGRHDPRTVLLFIVALTMIDSYESNMSRVYYYSPDLRLSKSRFLQFLTKTFVGRNNRDELELHLNIYLTCVLSEKPVETAQQFSLNFRTIRQISGHIHRVVEFVSHHHKIDRDWKTAMADEVRWKDRSAFSGKVVSACRIHNQSMDIIRTRFLHQSTIPIVRNSDFLMSSDWYQCIIKPSDEDRSSGVFIFHVDEEDDDIPHVDVFMYTRMPSNIFQHEIQFEELLQENVAELEEMREDICANKQVFHSTLEDIREDVFYRPDKEGCQLAMKDFYECLQKLKP